MKFWDLPRSSDSPSVFFWGLGQQLRICMLIIVTCGGLQCCMLLFISNFHAGVVQWWLVVREKKGPNVELPACEVVNEIQSMFLRKLIQLKHRFSVHKVASYVIFYHLFWTSSKTLQCSCKQPGDEAFDRRLQVRKPSEEGELWTTGDWRPNLGRAGELMQVVPWCWKALFENRHCSPLKTILSVWPYTERNPKPMDLRDPKGVRSHILRC